MKQEQIRLRGLNIRKQREDAAKKTADELATTRQKAADLEKRLAEADGWKKRALEDPEALKDIYGEKWYETVTAAKLGDPASLQVRQAEQRFQEKITALETKLAEREAAEASKLTAAEQQQADQDAADEREYSEGAAKYAKDHASELENINALGLHGSVAQRAKLIFEKTGKLPTEAEAAADVEKELDTIIEKVLATPKWQKKYAARLSDAEGPRFDQARRRSLGNDLTPMTPKPGEGKKLTKDEKREKSIKLLEEFERQQQK